MSNPNFHELVDDVFLSIEDSIEDSDIDIDYENANGMLTLTFEENASQIILSRQFSTSEIWIAAKSGGFHFKLDQYDESWGLAKYSDWRDHESVLIKSLFSAIWS